MNEIEKDVHTEHCCIRHGCKYGDKDCTVETGLKPQSYLCEFCDYCWENTEAENKVIWEKIKYLYTQAQADCNPQSICNGCMRPEIHKACPAHGTMFYMSEIPYTEVIEKVYRKLKSIELEPEALFMTMYEYMKARQEHEKNI